MRNIENRPIGCPHCNSQVNGKESEMETREGILYECRWTCPKCGRLVRVEEELDEITE